MTLSCPLTGKEVEEPNQKHRDPRFLRYAFTEQGLAMLSSALRSRRAVLVNIAVMRTFPSAPDTGIKC